MYIVKYVSYNNELLYCATTNDIHVVKVPIDSDEVDVSGLTQRVIEPGLPIQGLPLNEYAINDKFQLVALETNDNQLDFNRLFIENFDDDDSYKYYWT